MEKANLRSVLKLNVNFHECDPLQIVWHGNYLKYFEECREDFCRNHGISYLDAIKNGFSTPIVKSNCEHKASLKYGDQFEIETTFINSAAARMTFDYRIFLSEKLVCTGQTTQVFLNEKGELQLYNPPFFLDWKQKMELI